MKNQIFTKGQQINAGNFWVSIGTFDTSDVALFSKSSGKFVQLKQTKVSKKLRKVKRVFKIWLSCTETFNFRFMTQDKTIELINILRK
jgi:hypothetical protein